MAIPGSAGSFALAEAFVRIRPDTDGFRRDADAQLKREMAGDKVTVPVHAEVDISDLRRQLGTITVTEAVTAPDPGKITAALQILKQKMSALGIADIADVNVDPGKIAQSLQRMKILLQRVPGGSLPGLADMMDINIPVSTITTQLERIKNILNKASGQSAVADLLDVNLNTAQVQAGINKIQKAFAALAPGETIPLGLSDPGVLNSINAVRQAIGSLEGSQGNVVLPTAVFPPGELNQLTLFGDEIQKLKTDSGTGWNWAATVTGFQNTGQAASNAATILEEWLAANENATAGLKDLDAELKEKPGDLGAAGGAAKATGDKFLLLGRTIVANVGWWTLLHAGIDLAAESLIAVVGAALAAATGIAALVPVMTDIYNHIHAVNQVNSALGDQIPVLGANFRNFAESLGTASAGAELYGQAVTAISGKTGALAQSAAAVITVFEDWAAKIAIWLQAQNNFGAVLNQGRGYLVQFGQILANLFIAIDNLIKADPGVVHFFLDFVNGLATLFRIATSIPQPVLQIALGLHAVYLYGKLAGGVLSAIGFVMGGPLGKAIGTFGNLLRDLARNPALLLIGATALGIANNWNTATPQITGDINKINTALSQMTASQAIATIPRFIGQLSAALNNVSTAQAEKGFESFRGTLQAAGDNIQVIGHDLSDSVNIHKTFEQQAVAAWHAVYQATFGGLNTTAQATQEVGNTTARVHAEIAKLLTDEAGLLKVVGDLSAGTVTASHATYTYAQSLALMDLAGVKAGDSQQLAEQKVRGLLQGYEALSVQGPILAASVNAVTLATEQQQSQITALNQGWDAFFNLVSGGVSDMYAFEANLKTLDTQAGVSTKNLGLLSQGALTTGQDFIQSAQGANQMADQITSMVSAAGLGAHGTDLITASVKDYVALLLPAAKGSADFTSILYSMAQRGGYTGANSFQELSKWVATASGTVKAMGASGGPAQQLQGTMTALTGDVGNLTTDVQNLATALHDNLTNAMATAAFAASGGQKAFTDFATAIDTTGKNSVADIQTGTKLVQSLITQTGSAQQAHDMFILFAKQALHLTTTEANTLWTEIDAQLIPAVAKSGTTAAASSQQISDTFLKTLTAIHGLSPQLDSDVSAFTTAVQKTGDTSTRTQGARAQLIKDLEKAGYSAQAAAGLVDGLQAQINNLHGKNVNFVMTGQGAGQLYFNATTGVGGSISGGLKFLAGGGHVAGPGGPTSDVIPIMASSGEYVINAKSAKKLGLAQLDALNKYAGGGLVGGNFAAFEAGAGAGLNRASNFIAGNELAWGEDVARNWAAKVIAAVKAKLAAAAAKVAAGTPVAWSKVAGVTQWEGVALQALSLLGLPASDLPTVMAQILTESGGNPNAINLTDINAQQGDPSRGLLQVIGTTFAAYRNAGLSSNIYDPLANIYAGLNYAIHRYGNPGWLGVLGHGHGYGYGGQVMDSGGWLPPGRSLVWNRTGGYEHLSRDAGSEAAGGWHASLDDVCTKLDALIGVTGQQGRSFAGALNGTAASAGTRGSYSTRRLLLTSNREKVTSSGHFCLGQPRHRRGHRADGAPRRHPLGQPDVPRRRLPHPAAVLPRRPPADDRFRRHLDPRRRAAVRRPRVGPHDHPECADPRAGLQDPGRRARAAAEDHRRPALAADLDPGIGRGPADAADGTGLLPRPAVGAAAGRPGRLPGAGPGFLRGPGHGQVRGAALRPLQHPAADRVRRTHRDDQRPRHAARARGAGRLQHHQQPAVLAVSQVYRRPEHLLLGPCSPPVQP